MLRFLLLGLLVQAAPAGQSSSERPRKNPFSHTRESVERGRQLYGKHCTPCHDPKGKPLLPRDPGATRPADLTRPADWVHGASDAEVFDTIREGTEEMRGFGDKLADEEIWRIVHFLRSLAPKESR